MSKESVDWESFRRAMPVAERWAYFDHAAVSPLPQPTKDAIVRWLTDACNDGDVAWLSWSEQVETTRLLAARLIGADPEEIALIPNTTFGINLVAQGVEWQPGDNVVTLADEFPSNQYAWILLEKLGVETRRVPTDNGRVDIKAIDRACDRRTRIVTISWVGYASGWRNDLSVLAEIAHRHGAKLFVDAIQGLGVFPLNVKETPVDFLAADGHKWLLSPEGAGIFFVRKELLDWLRPVGIGWHSMVDAHDYSRIEVRLKPSAERYEGGSQNMAGFIGLGASLKLLLKFGVPNIAKRVLELTDRACDRLQQIGATIFSDRSEEHKSGIVSFELPGVDPVMARRECLASGIVLSCRNGRLRISPHAYNNVDDIEQLVTVLERLRRTEEAPRK